MPKQALRPALSFRSVVCFLASFLVAAGTRAELGFSEWQQDKQGSSLLGGNETSLAISPDGRNLYAAEKDGYAVQVRQGNAVQRHLLLTDPG